MFTPNNNIKSKYLYTGRTKDLDNIIDLLRNGNSIALFGERRSGKTLTLEIIDSIINKSINKIKGKLIDKKLESNIDIWQEKLSSFTSIYITLHGTDSENELCDKIQEVIQTSNNITIKRIYSKIKSNTELALLLNKLQYEIKKINKKLVILIDEMETLNRFKNSEKICGIFCDQSKYPEILYIHAGSYLWKRQVNNPGSSFTHLIEYYITSIDKNDLYDFLLSKISNKEIKKFIIDMSGCKPLYVQFIGRIFVKNGNKIAENDLHEDINLCEQIRNNIYFEQHLSKESEMILSLLCHYPNKTKRWILNKLESEKEKTRNSLIDLEKFGTIARNKNKFSIVGKFIEDYGKEIRDNPIRVRTNFLKKIKIILNFLRPIASICLLYVIFWIHQYSNPSTKSVKYSIPEYGIITFTFPESLEIEEKNILELYLFNNKSMPIDSLRLELVSNTIDLTNKNNSNTVEFKDVTSNQKIKKEFSISAKSVPVDSIVVKVSASNENIGEFKIAQRKLPIKKYSSILSVFFSLLVASLGLSSKLNVVPLIRKILNF